MWLRVQKVVALGVAAHFVSACRSHVYVGGIAYDAAGGMEDVLSPAGDASGDAHIDASDVSPGDGPSIPIFRYLHTSGAKIVDSADHEVRLRCANWSGFETFLRTVDGLHASPLDVLVGKIASLHFNCIRLPYCNDVLRDDSIPSEVDAGMSPVMANPELVGKTSLAVLEALMRSAEAQGLYVLLARHAPQPDTLRYPVWDGTDAAVAALVDARWIADWQTLATVSTRHPNLVGFDLHDEPGDPSTWNSGDPSLDWAPAATRAGQAILTINPQLLIIVSGIQSGGAQTYWPGGNLATVPSGPVVLDPPTQVVYAAHDYGSGKMNQTWFSDPMFPANLAPMWDALWGVVFADAQAPHPVFIASFGDRGDATGVSAMEADTDGRWMATLVDYLDSHRLSFGFWAFNPSAGGLTGLLQPGWQTFNPYQTNRIAALLTP